MKPKQLTGDVYKDNFHYDKSRFACLDKCHLQLVRVCMLIVMFIMMASTIVVSDWIWFIEYETYWGYFLSVLSLLASAKAGIKGQDSSWFKLACITEEIMMGFNFCCTVLFWTVLVPIIFPKIDWHGIGIYNGVRMITLHSVPMITSIVNFVLTDVTFQKSDWKYVFATGMAYIPANGFGTWMMGYPLYPIVDWKNPLETIGLFTLQAVVMTLFYYFICWVQHKCFKARK